MSLKTKIIANPIAGLGKGRRYAQKLVSALNETGIDSTIHYTSRANEARYLARDTQEADTIICIGGDGTVNEVINGLLENTHESNKPLAVLPIGAGNVIAKELKLSRDIKQFVRLLKTHKTVKLDVGIISFPKAPTPIKRKFISMAGSAFDAEMARRYHLIRKDGVFLHPHYFSYLPLGLRTISNYKMPRISIEIDGKLHTENASFVQVANARSYGGPFTFVPQAQPHDGWLEILWYTGRRKWDIIRYYWHAFTGNGTNCSDAHHVRGRKVVLGSDQRLPIQVDGDCCGYLPAEISIIPQAVSFLVNRKT